MIYKLEPILTYNLWGGNKLSKIYKKKIDTYGEAWVMSSIHDKHSLIEGSKLTLNDVFRKDKSIVKKGYKGEFPLLIKLIDAKDDLSIQVHPEVKTEFWHVLNLKPSHLYMGFKKDTSKKEIEEILNHGDITKTLNHPSVKEGASYLIKPGTIHAIGKGTFLIEIQRSADVTYRLYDFHRKDKFGKERELHIPQALKVINYKKLSIKKGKDKGLIVSCPFFKVYKENINKEVSHTANDLSFHSVIVLNGSGYLINKNEKIKLNSYDSVFIPASSGKYILKGKMTIVRTTL